MQMQMETNGFVESIMFSDEATFHLSGKVNRHYVRLGSPNPHVIVEYVRDSPDKCFLRHVMEKDLWVIFFLERIISYNNFLDMLYNG